MSVHTPARSVETFRRIARFAAVVILAACAGGDTPTGPVTPPPGGHGNGGGTSLAIVRVTPSTASVSVGGTTRLIASPTDASGRVVGGVTVSWTSLETDVASVGSDGTVSGRQAGQARIVARAQGFADTATITVAGVAGGSVTVEPATLAVRLGTTGVLTASVRDESGAVIGTDVGQPVTWSTDSPATVSVSGSGSSGIVSGKAVGTARVIATRGAKADTSLVTVSLTSVTGVVATLKVTPSPVSVARGRTVQLTTVARDAQGGLVTGYPLVWMSLTTSVATVSVGGTVTGIAEGSARVVAITGGIADTVTVTVGPPAVASVLVSPGTVTLSIGAATTLAAVARDARDNALAGRIISWRSDSPQIADVTSTGQVTALAAGVARIIASAEGHADTAFVTVRAGTAPPTAATVSVSPSPVSLTMGGSQALAAVVRDASGGTMGSAVVAWKTSNAAVATVSASGVVTATGAGSATITATSGSASGTAAVTVAAVAPTAASVTVAPSPVSLTVGGSQALAATVRDASGGSMGDATVAWKTSNAAVATVSGTGVVTAAGAGSATITATSGSVSGTAAVTVVAVAPTAASVSVSPSPVSLTTGGTQALDAVVRDAGGTTMGGATVAWKTSNAAVATVSASGVVTATGAGSATITATSGSASGTATVTVTAPEPVPASVSVSPATLSVRTGVTEALVATVRDAGGAVIGGTSLTWKSSNSAVATVSSTGMVTAVAAGSATITVTAGTVSGTATVTVTDPVEETVQKQATDIGTIGIQGGAAAQLPGVLVAGDDDTNDFAPLQAFITYSLADLPAGARIGSASLGVTMESAGVFGNPFGLGGLYVEWASTLSINSAAPSTSSVLVTSSFAGTTATDVTALVTAARAAGASSITFRLRFAQPRNSNGATDQLELAAGALGITYSY